MFGLSGFKEEFVKLDVANKFLVVMLFLFPVLSLSVRHWLSGLYTFIFLTSLFIFWKKSTKLTGYEKILLIAFLALIISFIISATLNGWTESSVRRLGAELKLIMFFPVYLAIRQQPNAIRWLFAGVLGGGVVIGLQALYDTYFGSMQRGWGIYGPIIFGDLAALYFGFLLALYLRLKQELSKPLHIYFLSGISLSLIAAILSGSRNAWIAVLVIIVAVGAMNYKRTSLARLLKGLLLIVIGVILLISISPSSIYTRADTALNEFKNYMDIEKRNNSQLIGDSVGIRLEQWRVALNLVLEKPIFGFGGGNAGRETNRYVKMGKAHPDLYNEKAYTGYAGAHSAYFETMITEGLTGLFILLFILLFPFYIYSNSRSSNPITSELGLVLSVSFVVFSLTENPFVHDNFLSTYFIFFSTIISASLLTQNDNWIHYYNDKTELINK